MAWANSRPSRTSLAVVAFERREQIKGKAKAKQSKGKAKH
jgi:hypothetical protein